MHSPQPYAGITGFTTDAHVSHGLRYFAEAGFAPDADHIGMVGFAVDHGIIRSGKAHPHAPRYFRNAADIAPLAERTRQHALNVVHYTPPERQFAAADAREVVAELYQANLCRTLQINGDTPDANEVEALLREFPDLGVVFSIHPELIRAGNGHIVESLRRYRGNVRYALIDPSLGESKDIQVETAADIAKALEDADLGITIGFAGGFSGENAAGRIAQLRKALGHSRFSVDAEGKLHTKDDRLDPAKMQSYLQAVKQGFSS